MMKYLIYLFVLLSFTQCSFFQKVKDDRLGNRKQVVRNYGNRFEVYYGAQTVGWCDYNQVRLEYSDTDVEIQEIFNEEINFRGTRYLFKFVLIRQMTEIHVLRYNKDGITFRPNDSYAVIKAGDQVVYRFYGDDGKSVIREVEIRDPQKIANTRELFNFCDSYLGTYFNIFENRKSREMRKNRIQSLAYDILQFDRI